MGTPSRDIENRCVWDGVPIFGAWFRGPHFWSGSGRFQVEEFCCPWGWLGGPAGSQAVGQAWLVELALLLHCFTASLFHCSTASLLHRFTASLLLHCFAVPLFNAAPGIAYYLREPPGPSLFYTTSASLPDLPGIAHYLREPPAPSLFYTTSASLPDVRNTRNKHAAHPEIHAFTASLLRFPWVCPSQA